MVEDTRILPWAATTKSRTSTAKPNADSSSAVPGELIAKMPGYDLRTACVALGLDSSGAVAILKQRLSAAAG
jgi:hypothetical protein